ncbi:conserved hypothetical protein [Ricinus communis]|uniref:DUF4283 domain-containing protein n=1 Tax=Ricinus communis TaxID=3988 RepID=B9RHF4_RICCO|nr:conserved hypothetical protein [Ricinus communis]
MVKELENLLDKFSLTDAEEKVVDLGESKEGADQNFFVLGRVLSLMPFNVIAMKNAMTGAWKPSHGFTIKELSNNNFVFIFHSRSDVRIVLNNGPRHFNENLLIFKDLRDDQPAILCVNEALHMRKSRDSCFFHFL